MITSRNNDLIKKIASLKEKKNRDKYNLFVIDGERFVDEALNKNFKLIYLFYLKGKGDKYAFIDEAIEVNKEVMEKISDTKTPSGVIGVFESRNNERNYFKEAEKILYLDCVQNSDNVGALVRSADAAGFDRVILNSGCADAFSPKAIRASAGSVLNIEIDFEESLDVLDELLSLNYKIIAGDLKGDEKFEFPNKKIVLIIGNEGNGISEKVREKCTDFVKIPIFGKAESLNAAVSGGILMYKIAGY